MEEKEKKENLPEKKVAETTEKKLEDTAKEKTEEKIDTSASEAETLGITKSKKDGIEEDDEQVSTTLKLDDKSKVEIRELLQDDLKNAVQDVKKDFLVIFGLFASFVIFISVNIQVFKNNNNTFELIGISSISLSFIVFFALIINGIAKGKTEWNDFKNPAYTIDFIFLVMGIIFLSMGNSQNTQTIQQLKEKTSADSIQINSLQVDVKKLNDKITQTDSAFVKFEIKFNKTQESSKPKDTNKNGSKTSDKKP